MNYGRIYVDGGASVILHQQNIGYFHKKSYQTGLVVVRYKSSELLFRYELCFQFQVKHLKNTEHEALQVLGVLKYISLSLRSFGKRQFTCFTSIARRYVDAATVVFIFSEFPKQIDTYISSRTTLDDGSARCRGLHLRNSQYSQETNIHDPEGFEPSVPESERPQTYALHRAASGICILCLQKLDIDYSMTPLFSRFYSSHCSWLPLTPCVRPTMHTKDHHVSLQSLQHLLRTCAGKSLPPRAFT